MKGQARNGWRETQTTRPTFVYYFLLNILLLNFLLLLVYWHGVGPKVFDVTGEIRLLIGCFFYRRALRISKPTIHLILTRKGIWSLSYAKNAFL